MGQRELRETVGVDPCALVTLLNPLKVRGFVSRERDRVDRRHVVMLTAASKRHFGSTTRAQAKAKMHCSPVSTTNAKHLSSSA